MKKRGTSSPETATQAPPRRRSAVDQLASIAARTHDREYRNVLLRQIAQLREVAARRTLRPRRA